MSETPSINLLESSTMICSITCQLPGDGTDTWRDFPFKATFKVLTEPEQEALDEQELTRGDYLREVVTGVEGVPGARDPKTGEEVAPKEVAIRNPFTMDALWGEYLVRFTRNSRGAAERAASRKNSKRSRKR